MNDKHLWELTDDFLAVQDMLDDPGEDQEAINDTLEAIHDTLEDKVNGVCFYIQAQVNSMAEIDAEIRRLQERKKMFDNRRERMRAYLQHHVSRLNDKKVETALHSVRIQRGRDSIVEDDLSLIPKKYIKTKESLDKTLLMQDAKKNEMTSGPGWHIKAGDPVMVIK